MPTSQLRVDQQGQSAMEYAIVLAAIATALLAPINGQNVLERLAEVLRDRNEGYGYAIAVVPPDPLLTPEMILPEFIDLGDPGPAALPPDEGDMSSSYEPSVSVPGGRVAVDLDNDPLGEVQADGRVVDTDGEVQGIAVGDTVYSIGADGEPAVDEDGNKTEIGTAHDVDEDGNVGDTGLELEDFAE